MSQEKPSSSIKKALAYLVVSVTMTGLVGCAGGGLVEHHRINHHALDLTLIKIGADIAI